MTKVSRETRGEGIALAHEWPFPDVVIAKPLVGARKALLAAYHDLQDGYSDYHPVWNERYICYQLQEASPVGYELAAMFNAALCKPGEDRHTTLEHWLIEQGIPLQYGEGEESDLIPLHLVAVQALRKRWILDVHQKYELLARKSRSIT